MAVPALLHALNTEYQDKKTSGSYGQQGVHYSTECVLLIYEQH